MSRTGSGIAFGLAAVLAWAVYNVGVEMGHAEGLNSADLTLLRYAGGAAVMLPLLLLGRANPFGGTTPLRLVVLVVVAGPPFAWAINIGYSLVPLSHAVVISPGMTMIVASLLTRLVGGRPIPPNRKIGMALLLAGLVIMASDRGGAKLPGVGTWAGDICFVLSGSLWGVFTWLMGHWRLDAVRSTGAIAIASSVIYLPIYLIWFDLPRLPAEVWAQQALYQGALGGALAVVFFTASIVRLGGGAAAVFPALVPPAAVLVAVPMAGRMPNGLQVAGIAAATLGLLISLDLIGTALRRWSQSPGRGTGCR